MKILPQVRSGDLTYVKTQESHAAYQPLRHDKTNTITPCTQTTFTLSRATDVGNNYLICDDVKCEDVI